MKKIVLLICSLFTGLLATSQSSNFEIINKPGSNFQDSQKLESNKIKLSAIYGGFGLGLCQNANSAGFSGTFILSNNWGGSISYKSNNFTAKNLPKDYESGLFDYNDDAIIVGNGIPRDYLQISSLCLVKEFPTETKRIRLGIEAGPSWVKYRAAKFTKHEPFLGFASNYEYSYKQQTSMGFYLRTKLEFPVAHYLGFELATFANLNNYRSLLGVELYITIGRLRESINNK